MNEDKQIATNDVPKAVEKKQPISEQLWTAFEPREVLKRAEKKLEELKGDSELYTGETTSEDDLFKAMTLSEFKNGALLTSVVAEQYKSFGIDLSRKLQEEYNCTTPSEKATAELAAVNYIRTLEIQNRITRYLGLGTITDIGVKFLNIMSIELDRANRHYLTAIQALETMKQPQLELILEQIQQ